MHASPYDYYQASLAAGDIRADPAQDAVMRELDWLAANIRPLTRKNWFPWGNRSEWRGLYIYGPVGRGKTMLMDMFFRSVEGVPKRRTHFHAFMAETHARLHDLRGQTGGEVLQRLAASIAAESRLICFDEFQVHNIADAMILSRLFRFLFREGVVIVATSNTAPGDLYQGGLQRHLFLPAIELLKKRLKVVAVGCGLDYRQARLKGLPVYLVPHDNQAFMALQKIFINLTDTPQPLSAALEIGGRSLQVPRAARGVAWFTFADLCEAPLAASDYLALAKHFHTFILENVPALDDTRRDAALRFIHLVDVLYEKHRTLVISAARDAAHLLDPASSLAAQYARTASRLAEMQSHDYLMAPHAGVHANP